MAKVKYSKYDVYDFLDSKKAEILEKKLAPLYKIRDEIKYEGIKTKYSKINIEKLKKNKILIKTNRNIIIFIINLLVFLGNN